MKPEKSKFQLFIIAAMAIGLIVGCTTTQQKTTFNALQTTETLADNGFTNYCKLVISGQIPTNNLPQAAKAYNVLHADIAAAAVLDQAGTNAFVSTNIANELAAFLNIIATATSK